MFVTEVLELYRNLYIRNEQAISRCSGFLKQGTYTANLAGDVLYIEGYSPYSMATFSSFSLGSNIMQRIRRTLVKKKVYRVDKNNDSYYNGSLLLISTSGNEYKIFDYSQNSVITIYDDLEKMDFILKQINHFSQYFATVEIERVNQAEGYIVEPIIEKKDFSHQNAFETIMSQYITYFEETEKDYSKCEDLRERVVLFEECFSYKCDKRLLSELPMVYAHGDLWSANIIFDSVQYYVIDFEHAKQEYFLFDFFMFIFSESFMLQEHDMLLRYFNGEYDDVLDRLFAAVGSNYRREKKNDYYIIFLSSIYHRRWKGIRSNTIRNRIREHIKKFLIVV